MGNSGVRSKTAQISLNESGTVFDGRASPDEEQSERTESVYDGLGRRTRYEHRGTTDKTEEAGDE